ncbi:MAG: hypothetical protein OQK94_08110 [Gammaproteobacteria bacterium]|nr:hypothetical protein [Gammaproteobacteria bacterium]MCW8839536.1 hypothetical protein [Gammaproteobacteria bacterium]MCW8928434.1 hypothetical protein [Gammaproteobacteria bacterium]MCW8959768.1 hypothetical protein [Gammaproteobacteria bacterium]MCW8972941.1 hypothetical protein [Gammaproteobacteria bacterium]
MTTLFTTRQAVVTPDALKLVANPIKGGTEAVEISLCPLDRPDGIGFGHAAGLDAMVFGDTTDGLNVHDALYPMKKSEQI